jgi:hypothetical protein
MMDIKTQAAKVAMALIQAGTLNTPSKTKNKMSGTAATRADHPRDPPMGVSGC